MIDIDVLAQLIPNPMTMVVQLCSTLVLFLLAKKFLWKSVKNWMGRRAEKMQSDLAESEQAKQDALADRKNAQAQLSAASGKADDIVSAAVKEAKSQKDEILAEAARQADLEKQKAHEQIEAERASMYEGMRKEMVDVAMAAAGKLIGEQSGKDLDRKAVDAFVKETTDGE